MWGTACVRHNEEDVVRMQLQVRTLLTSAFVLGIQLIMTLLRSGTYDLGSAFPRPTSKENFICVYRSRYKVLSCTSQ